KVLLKKFEGNQLGQAYEQFVALDPVLLLKDDLTLARRALLHEYVMHMEKDLDHEGLAELGASLYDNGKPKDYFNLVHNVRPVVETIGGDDGMLAGFETVAELFAAKKHEELFIKFKEAFKGTEEEAISVFQLAFPTLKVGKTGEYVEDDEGIEEQVALVKAENAPTES
ncbi:hypothetical protein HOE67_03865, partial [Candidatus Peregrinibacteria bacterium]|nr:hypothetical protein [Candidatus Peregrinibacteria bacterium]